MGISVDDSFTTNLKSDFRSVACIGRACNMDSILIKDTTCEERERIVAESLGNIIGSCDGCMAGLAEMYQDYIEGKKEIRDINMEFNARYVSGAEGPEKKSCGKT